MLRDMIVTHGLMSRVFLMKWYHFSVEYFEDLRNVNHCEFLIMRKKEDSGKYILENNLRTWSELKRERLMAAAAKEKSNPSSSTLSEKDKEKEKKLLEGTAAASSGPPGRGSPIPVRKKWGGCPNGCDHGKHYFKKENSMHAMQTNGKPLTTAPGSPIDSIQIRRPAARRWQSSSEEDEDDPRGRVGPPVNGKEEKGKDGLGVDVKKSLDEVVSSPDGTPSFISVEDRLRTHLKSPMHDTLLVKSAGRDFGGSASGNTSQAGSDTEFSAEEEVRKRGAKGKLSRFASGDVKGDAKGQVDRKELTRMREKSSMGRGAMADALGDQSDVGSDAGSEIDPDIPGVAELEKAEKEEKSVRGSVY
jgi:hypothetical protein